MSGLFQAVPIGYVLTSGANSALTWTNALTTSTISASTLNASALTVSTLTVNSLETTSTTTTKLLNYSSIVGSSISTNAMTLSLTNVSTQNTQIYQVATTNPTTSYTAIQASHVSTGTTNNALALNPSGGNVGVGTTAPIAPLHVYNSAGISLSNTSAVNYTQSATLGFNYGGGSAGTRDSFRIVTNVVNRDNGAGPFYDYGAQADLVFQRKTNTTYSSGANDTTYTEVMRLGGATGNVGIGYNAPTASLHVLNPTPQAGNTTMVTAQIIGRPPTVSVQNAMSCGFAIGAAASGIQPVGRMDVMVSGVGASGNNYGYVPDIPVATFLGNGNVGVGTTAPATTLHITNSTSDPTIGPDFLVSTGHGQILLRNTKTGSSPYSMTIGVDQTTGAGYMNAAGNSIFQPVCLQTRGGNVGVGTTNPSANLHIIGATSIANTTTLKVLNSGAGQNVTGSDLVTTQIDLGAGYGPYLRAVQPNTAYTDGIRLDLCTNLSGNNGTPTPRLTILPVSGNVGIGTTVPAQLLDITNATSATPAIRLQSQYAAAYMSMGVNVGVNSYIGLQAGAATTTALGTPTLAVTNGGNVGIGYTTPAASLHVLNPTPQAGNTTMVTAQIIGRPGTAGVQDGTSCGFAIGASGGLPNAASRMDVMVGGTSYAGNNWGYTPDVSVATFLGNGNVGIGTTTPSAPLHVVGNATINVGTTAWMIKGGGGLYTSSGPVTFNTVSIYAAGSIWAGDVIGCTNVNSFSDQRIKENIQPVSAIFDLIHQVEIVSYDHIDVRKKSVRIGVVAQQLQPFFPEIIDKAKNWVPIPYNYATSHERHDDRVIIMVDASASELQVGRQIRLYIGKNDTETQYDTEILERTPTSITCKVWGDTYDATDRVFVYGVEVDDFLVVDKAQLGLLALAGVQEIHKTVETLQAQNEALQAQNQTLQAQNKTLQSQLASLIAWAQTMGYPASS